MTEHPGTIWRRYGAQRVADAFAEALAGVPTPAVVWTAAACHAAADLLGEPTHQWLIFGDRGRKVLDSLARQRLVERVTFDDEDWRDYWRWVGGEG